MLSLDIFKLNKIQKYIFKLNLWYYLGSFLLFVILFLLGSLRLIIDSILSTSSISFFVILKLLILTIPQHIMISAPVAMNLSLALLFGNLSVNNEILAIKSFGVNLNIFLKPIIYFSIIIALFIYFDMEVLLSYSKNLYLEELNKHRVKSIESSIHENKIGKYSNYEIYVEKVKLEGKDKRKIFLNIKIFEKSPEFERLIYAQKGNIIDFIDDDGESSVALYLENGYLITNNYNNDHKLEIIKIYFDNFVIYFPQIKYYITADILEKNFSYLRSEIKKVKESNKKLIKNLIENNPGLTEKEILKNPYNYGLDNPRYIESIYYLKIGIIISTFIFALSGYSIVKGFRNLNIGFSLFISFIMIMLFYAVFLIFINYMVAKTKLSIPLLYSLVLGFLSVLSIILIIRGRKF